MTAEIVYQRPAYAYSWYYPQSFLSSIVNGILGIIEALLALRLVLQLLGAGTSPFVAWVYDITNRLASPFLGAFPALAVGGFMLDLSIVFAMIGYAVIAWLLLYLFDFIFSSINRIA
jgi:hypothetical protein